MTRYFYIWKPQICLKWNLRNRTLLYTSANLNCNIYLLNCKFSLFLKQQYVANLKTVIVYSIYFKHLEGLYVYAWRWLQTYECWRPQNFIINLHSNPWKSCYNSWLPKLFLKLKTGLFVYKSTKNLCIGRNKINLLSYIICL